MVDSAKPDATRSLPFRPDGTADDEGGAASLTARLGQWRDNPLAARAFWPAMGASALALGLIAYLALSPAGRSPLYGQLPDADKAAVVSALEGAGLDVALDPRTGAVLLPPDDHARARMLLAAQGLPKAAPAATDMLMDLPLGASRAVEGARLKAAGERDLARAIESLDGVDSALVLIARPEPSPFIREQAPPTASVTLTLAPGRSLGASQARAIVHLVAGAVPGLRPDQVAIADQSGRLLAGGAEARDRMIEDRLALRARMEARARESILSVLNPMLGPGNVTAEVAIELDFASREAAQESYEREGALRSEQTSRSTTSQPRAIGIPGALTNSLPSAATVTAAPPPAAPPAENQASDESATRNYELGRSVEVTSRTGGEIRRLTAAVAVRADALGPAEGRARMLAEIRELAEAAVGHDASRGDRIAVAARPFAPPADNAPPLWRDPLAIEGAKWLATALVIIALLALVVRPMLARWLPPAARLRDGAAEGVAASGPIALTSIPVPEESLHAPVDYAGKLEEARRLAASDNARATLVARRLLAAPSEG